jgi:CheY-like chemotaxis protein
VAGDGPAGSGLKLVDEAAASLYYTTVHLIWIGQGPVNFAVFEPNSTLTVTSKGLMMSKKHVLIVDDAKDILFLLTHSVKRLGPEYEVSTATDGPAALEQMEKQRFDLVITDYMMGSMTGLDLAQQIRVKSPHTQVVLMSAYDTTNLRKSAKDLNLSGYVGKPFTVPEVLEVVQNAVAQAGPAEPDETEATGKDNVINKPLRTLYNKTGANYVLLLNARGQPVHVVGKTEPATLSRLANFVAGNFLAVTELASLLGDNSSVFKSSYYEGNNYNIYAHDINGEYMLAVVFGSKDKPGTVWFYTKQTATDLLPHLSRVAEAENDQLKEIVAAEFNELLGDEK